MCVLHTWWTLANIGLPKYHSTMGVLGPIRAKIEHASARATTIDCASRTHPRCGCRVELAMSNHRPYIAARHLRSTTQTDGGTPSPNGVSDLGFK